MLSQKKTKKKRENNQCITVVSEEAEDIHDKIPARDAENEALNGDSQIEVTESTKEPTQQDETLL